MKATRSFLNTIGFAILILIFMMGILGIYTVAKNRPQEAAADYAATANAQAMLTQQAEIISLHSLLHRAEAASDSIRIEGYFQGYYESCIKVAALSPTVCDQKRAARKAELGVGP